MVISNTFYGFIMDFFSRIKKTKTKAHSMRWNPLVDSELDYTETPTTKNL